MTEYTNTCGLGGSAQSFHIVNKSTINPAPAFRMTQGTRWIWFVPVRAVAPNTTADTIVSVWAKEFGVDDRLPARISKLSSETPTRPSGRPTAMRPASTVRP
jgi:hypothetical protein